MKIEIRDIIKRFRTFFALKGINLTIPTGELVALLGPSGSGKTTLLRIIAGLEAPDAGQIFFDEDNITDKKLRDRQVGFVFQHYALFRHMTVFENVAFGLKVKPPSIRPSKKEIQEKVGELLKLVQLEWLTEHYPSQLSGGQRQRVALARALAVEPKILLLDEPFGALDAKVRKDLRRWLRKLHDEIHVTSVFVTHDQEEALEVADKVVVLNEGQIEQVGSPQELYDSPANRFVHNFLGETNLFHGIVEGGKVFVGMMEVGLQHGIRPIGEKAIVYIRPHKLEVHAQLPGQGCFRARVRYVNAIGPLVKVELVTWEGDSFYAEMPHERFRALDLKKDTEVYVTSRDKHSFVEFPQEDGGKAAGTGQ